jgi:glycosyltransferase involved in cell wall biosynthesis
MLRRRQRTVKRKQDRELAAFVASGSVLGKLRSASPIVSVVIYDYGTEACLLACLKSVAANTNWPLEVLVLAEPYGTNRLLWQVPDARIVLGGPQAETTELNQAAGRARGRVLLFLDGQSQLGAGSVEAALECLDVQKAGVAGGKTLLVNERLADAGYTADRDARLLPYGREDAPEKPAYMYRRDVLAPSAEAVFTTRDLFQECGGYASGATASRFRDGVAYRLADYCLRAREIGARVLYDPRIAAVTLRPMARGGVSADREAGWLHARHAASLRTAATVARNAALPVWPRLPGKRILLLDQAVPHLGIGHGLARAHQLICELVALGHQVTVYPLVAPAESWSEAYRDLDRSVEIVLGAGPKGLRRFLRERWSYYNVIIASRVHNCRVLRAITKGWVRAHNEPQFVYDAEAIAAVRIASRSSVLGRAISDRLLLQNCIREEVREVAWCDAAVAVSSREKRLLVENGIPEVHVLSYIAEPAPTGTTFEERKGFLFVGPLDTSEANIDGMRWYCRCVLPVIRGRMGPAAPLIVVGRHNTEIARELEGMDVVLAGHVDDLRPFFEKTRVFVAPIRFGAGIPLKVIESAAHGVPVVTTSLLGELLDWHPGHELLVADHADAFADACLTLHQDADLWQHLRSSALSRVTADYSAARFRAAVKGIVERREA